MRNLLILIFMGLWMIGSGSPVRAGDLLVGTTEPGNIREFDSQSGKFLGYFGEVQQNAKTVRDLVVQPSTGHILILDDWPNDKGIKQFDGATGTYLGFFGQADATNLETPISLEIHPGSGNLIVMDKLATGLVVFKEFDGTTGNFVGIFSNTGIINPILSQGPSQFAFHPTTGNLFFSNPMLIVNVTDILEIDGTTGAMLPKFAQIPTLSVNGSMIFNPTSGNLLFASQESGVTEFNGANGNLIGPFGQTVFSTRNILDIAIHPNSNNLWLIDSSEGSIKEFDGAAGDYIRIVHEGLGKMGSLVFKSSGVGGPNLKVVETGDFNGDGFSDLLLADPVDGTLAIAFLDGIQISNLQEFTTLDPATGWQIKGTDDFNNDGKADIHIFNTDSQLTGALIMDGFNITSVEFFHQEN